MAPSGHPCKKCLGTPLLTPRQWRPAWLWTNICFHDHTTIARCPCSPFGQTNNHHREADRFSYDTRLSTSPSCWCLRCTMLFLFLSCLFHSYLSGWGLPFLGRSPTDDISSTAPCWSSYAACRTHSRRSWRTAAAGSGPAAASPPSGAGCSGWPAAAGCCWGCRWSPGPCGGWLSFGTGSGTSWRQSRTSGRSTSPQPACPGRREKERVRRRAVTSRQPCSLLSQPHQHLDRRTVPLRLNPQVQLTSPLESGVRTIIEAANSVQTEGKAFRRNSSLNKVE